MCRKNKRGAPLNNKNATKPASERVDGGAYSRLNINIPRKLKSQLVREACENGENLTRLVIRKLAE